MKSYKRMMHTTFILLSLIVCSTTHAVGDKDEREVVLFDLKTVPKDIPEFKIERDAIYYIPRAKFNLKLIGKIRFFFVAKDGREFIGKLQVPLNNHKMAHIKQKSSVYAVIDRIVQNSKLRNENLDKYHEKIMDEIDFALAIAKDGETYNEWDSYFNDNVSNRYKSIYHVSSKPNKNKVDHTLLIRQPMEVKNNTDTPPISGDSTQPSQSSDKDEIKQMLETHRDELINLINGIESERNNRSVSLIIPVVIICTLIVISTAWILFLLWKNKAKMSSLASKLEGHMQSASKTDDNIERLIKQTIAGADNTSIPDIDDLRKLQNEALYIQNRLKTVPMKSQFQEEILAQVHTITSITKKLISSHEQDKEDKYKDMPIDICGIIGQAKASPVSVVIAINDEHKDEGSGQPIRTFEDSAHKISIDTRPEADTRSEAIKRNSREMGVSGMQSTTSKNLTTGASWPTESAKEEEDVAPNYYDIKDKNHIKRELENLLISQYQKIDKLNPHFSRVQQVINRHLELIDRPQDDESSQISAMVSFINFYISVSYDEQNAIKKFNDNYIIKTHGIQITAPSTGELIDNNMKGLTSEELNKELDFVDLSIITGRFNAKKYKRRGELEDDSIVKIVRPKIRCSKITFIQNAAVITHKVLESIHNNYNE